jgi:hypothetical protein
MAAVKLQFFEPYRINTHFPCKKFNNSHNPSRQTLVIKWLKIIFIVIYWVLVLPRNISVQFEMKTVKTH